MLRQAGSTVALLGALAAGWLGTVCAGAQVSANNTADDKYAWLEDVSGERSMAWVHAENARTAKVLESDPRYAANYDAALKVAEDPTRLPYPELHGAQVYNTWRDAKNPRGLWRRTSLSDYLSPAPHWQSVIDYDQLGRDERSAGCPAEQDACIRMTSCAWWGCLPVAKMPQRSANSI